MTKVTIRNIGAIGAVPDVPAHELPPEAWSTVQNVGFEDGYAFRHKGETQVEGTPSVAPYYLFPSPNTNASNWVYTDLDSVYTVAGGLHTDITRSGGIYTGGIDDTWTGGWLNGVLILNNGINDPQQWLPIDTSQRLTVLSNWPANTKARVMRVFQEFLIALDVTEAGVRSPTVLRWSQPADPGSVPSTWDYAASTNISGRRPIGSSAGFLVDAEPVGDSLLVWKEDSLHRMDRVQTNTIFTRRQIGATGLMAVGCAKELKPGLQFAFTIDADVAITDGTSPGTRSITNKRVRRRLESIVSGENRGRCFVVADRREKRAYVCYPREGDAYCTEAAVWNWEDDTWSFRQISQTLDIKSGLYDEDADPGTWDSDTGTWDSDTTTWDERSYVATSARMLGAYPIDNEIREFARGLQLGTTAYTSRLQRTGLAVAGMDRQGQPVVDTRTTKQVTSLAPIINTDLPMTMQISVGAQDQPNGAITWDGPYDFDPLVDEKVDVFVEGRYLAVRFDSASEANWKMQGYVLEVDAVGEEW